MDIEMRLPNGIMRLVSDSPRSCVKKEHDWVEPATKKSCHGLGCWHDVCLYCTLERVRYHKMSSKYSETLSVPGINPNDKLAVENVIRLDDNSVTVYNTDSDEEQVYFLDTKYIYEHRAEDANKEEHIPKIISKSMGRKSGDPNLDGSKNERIPKGAGRSMARKSGDAGADARKKAHARKPTLRYSYYDGDIPPENRFTGETDDCWAGLDPDKIIYVSGKDARGVPCYNIGDARPRWLYKTLIPHPHINNMPLDVQLQQRAEVENSQSNFAVKWITHWEFKGKRNVTRQDRIDRKRELMPAAKDYVRKHCYDIIISAYPGDEFLSGVIQLHNSMVKDGSGRPVATSQTMKARHPFGTMLGSPISSHLIATK